MAYFRFRPDEIVARAVAAVSAIDASSSMHLRSVTQVRAICDFASSSVLKVVPGSRFGGRAPRLKLRQLVRRFCFLL